MRRALLDSLTTLVGRLRHRQRLPAPDGPGPVNINVGSSLLVAPEWINVDGTLSSLLAGKPRPLLRIAYRLAGLGAQMSEEEYVAILSEHRFVHHDLRYGIPFPDACADVVFSSHTLEHLSRADGEALVRDAFRVLRPGGLVHISVPDLGELIGEFTAGQRYEAIDAAVRGPRARRLRPPPLPVRRGDVERAARARRVHRVRPCGYREGEAPDLEAIDHRPGSLVLEARKPDGS